MLNVEEPMKPIPKGNQIQILGKWRESYVANTLLKHTHVISHYQNNNLYHKTKERKIIFQFNLWTRF